MNRIKRRIILALSAMALAIVTVVPAQAHEGAFANCWPYNLGTQVVSTYDAYHQVEGSYEYFYWGTGALLDTDVYWATTSGDYYLASNGFFDHGSSTPFCWA